MEGKIALLPGEVCQHTDLVGNPYSDVRLNWQESAEAIVPERGRAEHEMR